MFDGGELVAPKITILLHANGNKVFYVNPRIKRLTLIFWTRCMSTLFLMGTFRFFHDEIQNGEVKNRELSVGVCLEITKADGVNHF